MPIANRNQREFHLFHDLFVHCERQKIMAVAAYYGDDFGFSEAGVDLRQVVLEVGGLRIVGQYRPYALDSFEPSVLFDFERPRLAELIAKNPELPVRIAAGDVVRNFWLDTTPPPPRRASLAVCIRDENRWIGFFDADELLHIPDSDLIGFLDTHDPLEVGGIAFKIRWCLYKGTKSLEAIQNPLEEFVYVQDDPTCEMRWKLFVSSRLVRQMRIHWIPDEQTTVHRHDLHYYHYFLRGFRFEEGKRETGLGAGVVTDDTMKRVWQHHASGAAAEQAGT